MGGYFCRVTNVGGGKSVVASAAYNSRDTMQNELSGDVFDYSRHTHDNTYSHVTITQNAPLQYKNKNVLWNAVEQAEEGKGTRKAKQWLFAIPQELTDQEQQVCVRRFQDFLAEKGMCSQADIHEPDSRRSAGKIEKNKHVHILATQRLILPDESWAKYKEKKVNANCLDSEGKPAYDPELPTDAAHRIPVIDPETGEQKLRIRKGKGAEKLWHRVTIEDNPLSNPELIEESRQKWAEICNHFLQEHQHIDHRSYARQGVERVPEVREGYGQYTNYDERVEYNRTVQAFNAAIEQTKSQVPEEIKQLKEELNGINRSIVTIGDNRGTAATPERAAADHQQPLQPEQRIEKATATETPGAAPDAARTATAERIDQARIRTQEGNSQITGRIDRLRESPSGISDRISGLRTAQSDAGGTAADIPDRIAGIRDNVAPVEAAESTKQRTERADSVVTRGIADTAGTAVQPDRVVKFGEAVGRIGEEQSQAADRLDSVRKGQSGTSDRISSLREAQSGAAETVGGITGRLKQLRDRIKQVIMSLINKPAAEPQPVPATVPEDNQKTLAVFREQLLRNNQPDHSAEMADYLARHKAKQKQWQEVGDMPQYNIPHHRKGR